MAYALTLLALLGFFLFATPARTFVVEKMHRGTVVAETLAASGSAPLTAKLQSVGESAQEKAMEFLREKLHHFIDGMVQ